MELSFADGEIEIMFKSVFRAVFGDPNLREIKKYTPLVEEANALEAEMQAKSDEEIRQMMVEFQGRLQAETAELRAEIGEMRQQVAVVTDDAPARAQCRIAEGLRIALQARQIEVFQGLDGEVFLAGEVVIEGALGDAGGLDDFLHAGAVIATAGHHLGAPGEDEVAFVESDSGHGGEHMTGRLALPSTIDRRD